MHLPGYLPVPFIWVRQWRLQYWWDSGFWKTSAIRWNSLWSSKYFPIYTLRKSATNSDHRKSFPLRIINIYRQNDGQLVCIGSIWGTSIWNNALGWCYYTFCQRWIRWNYMIIFAPIAMMLGVRREKRLLTRMKTDNCSLLGTWWLQEQYALPLKDLPFMKRYRPRNMLNLPSIQAAKAWHWQAVDRKSLWRKAHPSLYCREAVDRVIVQQVGWEDLLMEINRRFADPLVFKVMVNRKRSGSP